MASNPVTDEDLDRCRRALEKHTQDMPRVEIDKAFLLVVIEEVIASRKRIAELEPLASLGAAHMPREPPKCPCGAELEFQSSSIEHGIHIEQYCPKCGKYPENLYNENKE